jgi:DNA-binding NarL/FixJ family response regulator
LKQPSAVLCAVGDPYQQGQPLSSPDSLSDADSPIEDGCPDLPDVEPIQKGSATTEGGQDALLEQPIQAREEPGAALVRVLIVDEDPIMRARLRAILKRDGDLEIVGDTGDCAAAIILAESLRPDVALVDLNISGLDGFEIAGRIRNVSPETRVAMIGDRFETQVLEKGLAVGLHGFILKLEARDRMAAFVRVIARGAFCCSESVREALTLRSSSSKVEHHGDPRLQLLTVVEKQILVELAKGSSLKDAARVLQISYKAADHLKQSVMRKLDIHDRVEIARFAIREGLIT